MEGGRRNQPAAKSAPATDDRTVRVVVVSAIRFHQEGLASYLHSDPLIHVVGSVTHQSLQRVADFAPVDVLVIDAQRLDARALARQLRSLVAMPKIVLAGVTDEEIAIDWVEIGISGLVSINATREELVSAVHHAARGEFVCSPKAAAFFLSRLAAVSQLLLPQKSIAGLTAREKEILGLLDQGTSNKDIARRLSIGLPTVKNHVHSILAKLDLRRRSEIPARIRATEVWSAPHGTLE